MDVEIGNRPLLATARDQKLSIERAEVRRVAELARRGLNVLLVGERGSGKTSALHAVGYELREGGRRAELVDAAPAADLPELVRVIDRAVAPPREVGPLAAGARSDTSVVIELLRSWQAL